MIQEVQTEHVETEPLSVRESPLRAVPLWQMGVLAALFVWLYSSTVRHLVGQWWHDPNFSHGFFVPLFSAFVIWQERNRLAQDRSPAILVRRRSRCLAGLMMLIVGRLGAEIFLDRSSMLLVLAGVVILFVGWNLFRAVLVPLGFPAADDSNPRHRSESDHLPAAVAGLAGRRRNPPRAGSSGFARRQRDEPCGNASWKWPWPAAASAP